MLSVRDLQQGASRGPVRVLLALAIERREAERSDWPSAARHCPVDSAAAMVQAVAAFLHRRDVASLSGSRLLDGVMPIGNQLPDFLRECAYSVGGMTEAVSVVVSGANSTAVEFGAGANGPQPVQP
jgi:hypothetical protein